MPDAQQLNLLDYDAAAARAARDKALALLEATRKPWLIRAREAADALWQANHKPLTVDDIRLAVGKPPDGQDGRAFGAVFHHKKWRALDFVNSVRKTCHGRPIREFVKIEE